VTNGYDDFCSRAGLEHKVKKVQCVQSLNVVYSLREGCCRCYMLNRRHLIVCLVGMDSNSKFVLYIIHYAAAGCMP
jgi:hypothetical protein